MITSESFRRNKNVFLALLTVIIFCIFAINFQSLLVHSNKQVFTESSGYAFISLPQDSTQIVEPKQDSEEVTSYNSNTNNEKSKTSNSDSQNSEQNEPNNIDNNENPETNFGTTYNKDDLKNNNDDFIDVIVKLKDDNIPLITKDNLPETRSIIKTEQEKTLSNLNTNNFQIKYKYDTINAFAGKIRKEDLNKLKQDPNIEAVYEDEIFHATLSNSVPLINADNVWNLGITGNGSVVCVLDTGIDYTHPDLGNCSQYNINGTIESYSLESLHNYPDSYINTWTITKPGFSQIAVHFDRIGLEKESYDYIQILDSSNNLVQTIDISLPWDSNYCKDIYDLWSVSVSGNTIKVRLISDYSYNCYGFKIDKVLNGTTSFKGLQDCEKVIDGYDFVNNDTDPMDDNSHGTHVAGIVAANGSIKGVAPDAKLIAVKVLDSEGSGFSSDIAAGIDWCNNKSSDYNIVATTMSLGDSGQYNNQTCPTWIDNVINTAHNLGIAVTVASGNDAHSNGISYPACSPNAISVGSTTKSDVISSFTNTGSLLDLLAPGDSIYSTVLYSAYDTFSGTSMATPHVAGAIALLKQISPLLTPDEIESRLKSTGILITDPDNSLSFPRIDILAALPADLIITDSFVCPGNSNCLNTNNPKAGENLVVTFEIKNQGGLISENIEYKIDTNSTESNIVVNTNTILSPGGVMRVHAKYSYATATTYNPEIILDPDNKIPESNENNNNQTLTINVS